jgi:tryptophan synthase beta chain
MVRDFQSVIGREARAQIIEAEAAGCSDCVWVGEQCQGLFYTFVPETSIR